MDEMESFIGAAVAQAKQTEFAGKPIRTLGEVMLLLKAQPATNIVKIDFTDHNPTGVGSYRGYYEDIALEYDEDEVGELKTVKQLLKIFEDSIGEVYEGYKGGNSTPVSRKTIVWVSLWGDNSRRMLTDIKSEGIQTVIFTQEDTD